MAVLAVMLQPVSDSREKSGNSLLERRSHFLETIKARNERSSIFTAVGGSPEISTPTTAFADV
jgi:hypothetical protein